MQASSLKIVNTVARIGYSAKCVVYLALGTLIVYSAFTAFTAKDISKKTVFQEILTSPFGSISLSAIIIGLTCYVVWRLVQGVTNPDNLDMKKPSELLLRVFYFGSALLYTSVSYAAVKVLLGLLDSSEQQKEQVTRSILQETWGAVLVGVVSLIIMGFAVIQIKHAFKGDFMDKFVYSMKGISLTLARSFGRAGFAARGVLYFMVGSFYMHAAWTYSSENAGGMSKAITTLLQQPFGP